MYPRLAISHHSLMLRLCGHTVLCSVYYYCYGIYPVQEDQYMTDPSDGEAELLISKHYEHSQ